MLREQLYVVTLAKYGNLTTAAKELFISQPALSMFITHLEKNLGLKLFNRMGKKFVLTYAGEIYLDTARKMLSLERDFDTAISDVKKEAAGCIRFGMYLRRTTFLLPAVLSYFLKKHPNVNIALEEADYEILHAKLLMGELDFIIANDSEEQNDKLQYKYLFEDRLVAVVAEKNPLAVADRKKTVGEKYPWLDLKKFRDERFILPLAQQSTRKFINQALAYSMVTPQKVLFEKNMDTACQMAAEGVGIAFNMETYVKHFAYKKKFKIFYVGDPSFKVATRLIYRKDMYMANYMVSFVQILEECCKKRLY